MSTHTQHAPTGVEFRINRLARAVAVGLVLFAFGSAIAYGAYLAGQATRPTDAAISAERQAAVHLAVTKAVAAKGAADHLKRLRIVARHVAAERVADEQRMRQAVLAEQRAGDRRAVLAFDRGRRAHKARPHKQR